MLARIAPLVTAGRPRCPRCPYYLTPGWLRIDPNFDPLRGNPRFDKLAQGP